MTVRNRSLYPVTLTKDCHDWVRLDRYTRQCRACGKKDHQNVLHRELYEDALKRGWIKKP